MAKNVELLLLETVETLGIVGDVVKVRTGYARNYLLPNSMATAPTEEKIKALAVKRADAEAAQLRLRKEREELIKKLEGVEVTIQRSCNDQGQLYGSVSQQDIAEAMVAAGHPVRARDVRLSQVIKRIDSYHVPVKLDSDLEAEIKLWVVADRQLNLDEREELEFDNEGDLIEKPKRPRREREAEPADAAHPADKKHEGDKKHDAEKKPETDKKHAGEKKGKKDEGAGDAAPKKGSFEKKGDQAAAPAEAKKGFFEKREPKAETAPAEEDRKSKKRR